MKIISWIIKAALIYILILTLGPLSLKKAAQFLIVSAPITKSDVIIVLSGGQGNRVDKAVELYKNGLSKTIIMTGETILTASIPKHMKARAINQGIPASHIRIEDQSTSTYDHPTRCLPLIKELNAKSILLVTSNFHTRRSLKAFTKAYKTQNISVTICGAEDNIEYSSWWKNSRDAELILLEFSKHLWYWINY
jgi:uncharacterized SAM-binding protein YcdF (DUF218 family)